MRKLHRRTKRTTKSVLRLLDLEHAKNAVLNSLTSPDAQRGYRHAIDEFVDGIVRSPAWRSTGLSFCGIAHISNLANSHQARSTCALGPCGALLTKQPTVVCSVLDLASGIRRVRG